MKWEIVVLPRRIAGPAMAAALMVRARVPGTVWQPGMAGHSISPVWLRMKRFPGAGWAEV